VRALLSRTPEFDTACLLHCLDDGGRPHQTVVFVART
jgi:hypothetical protein